MPGSEYAISNDEFFDLDELPKKAVVIGGGYVALELATILQAAGSEVTVLQHSEKLLRPFDQEYVEKLTEMMEERGIAIHLNTPVKAIAKNSAAYEVTAESGQKFETDLVIDASGRRANVNGLGLEKLGIKFDPVKGGS
ncbi:FAD-dependent oxidoreductase [Lactobacillus delbrueckii subsp. bulgaricus]